MMKWCFFLPLIADRSDFSRATEAPASCQADRVLLRGRAQAPGIRIHAARKLGESALQKYALHFSTTIFVFLDWKILYLVSKMS